MIVDNTQDNSTDTGNSVGKSTVIQLIDICLGAKTVATLYKDKDTHSENDKIKSFLADNQVEAELTVVNEKQTQRYVIRRGLYKNGKRLIEDEPYIQNEFSQKLKEIMFNSSEAKPTFRSLIPKFIRTSDVSDNKMIMYLQNTKNDEYDAIYSFLFKVSPSSLIDKKSSLNSRIDECDKALKVLKKSLNVNSVNELNQKMSLIEDDLDGVMTQRKEVSYIEAYKAELETKRHITTRIDEIEKKIQLVEYEIGLLENRLGQLIKEKCNIDLNMLKQIYLEAQYYIADLQKKFEDVVNFHDTMLQNRIEFITNNVEKKKEIQSELLNQQEVLLVEKRKITVEVLDEGLLDELNLLNNRIEELTMQKGQLMQAIKLINEQEEFKNQYNDELQKVESEMDDTMDLDNKISKFNQIFSRYCDQLYGEKYYIAFNRNWKKEKGFPVTLKALDENAGTGKKKALIVAFDLAYMEYASTFNIVAPQFVVHDKMETTHANQLRSVFEICKNIQGQYILPILRERIREIEDRYVQDAIVLELSTSDKFFKI